MVMGVMDLVQARSRFLNENYNQNHEGSPSDFVMVTVVNVDTLMGEARSPDHRISGSVKSVSIITRAHCKGGPSQWSQ